MNNAVSRKVGLFKSEDLDVKAHELFGVAVRVIGLVLVLSSIPTAFLNPFVGAGYAVMGLLLLALANPIVRLCYGNEAQQV